LNKFLLAFFSLLIILTYSVSNYAYATHFHTFNNPTPEPNDWFGKSISIDGNHVLVGADRDKTKGNNAGAAYLFDTSGNLLQTFYSPNPKGGDFFGNSVEIDGNNVLVGAIGLDDAAEHEGAVYLFDTSGNLLQTFYNPTDECDKPCKRDNFGHSLSIFGNKILVGAYTDDIGAEDAGAAYLFDISGNLLQTFNKPNPMPGDNFGLSVKIYENYVLVGADHDDVEVEEEGSAYLFDTSGNLLQTFNNPNPMPGDRFGHTVAISGNHVLTGPPNNIVYLFDTSGNLLQTFNDPGNDNAFGHWVSISGNNVLIGANLDDTGANNAGTAYLFDTSGNLLQTFNNPTPSFNDKFGHTVVISGNHVLVNAYDDDTGAENTGSVYLFYLSHDRTALFLSDVQANAVWIIPLVIAVAIGVGVLFLKKSSNRSEN